MPAPRITFSPSVRKECLRPIPSVAGQSSHNYITPFLIPYLSISFTTPVLPKLTAKLHT